MFTIIILIKQYVIMFNTINIDRHTRADTRVKNTLPKMRRVYKDMMSFEMADCVLD